MTKKLMIMVVALMSMVVSEVQAVEPLMEGLGSLPVLKDYRAKRVSSYDKTGGNADYVAGIAPGETVVLADIEGPGMIHHIWITIHAERFFGRKILLRMYWDDEKDPSVLCPINDFFCSGHGLNRNVTSIPISVTSYGKSLNSFFKMPFNKRARIEITNEGLEGVILFYWYVDYREYKKPFTNMGYFHARYRQEYPAVGGRNYQICDLLGRGHFVGCVYSIETDGDGWWGEGDDRWFIDGESKPSLHGTGSEDFLCQAWGVDDRLTPYFGTTLKEGEHYKKGNRYTSYRFYIEDPVPFEKSLKLEIEHYGGAYDKDGKELAGMAERPDNISSVAYWYQVEAHKPWEPIAPVDQRLPKKAGKEILYLGFLRKAAEFSAGEAIEPLRSQYKTLSSDRDLAVYSGDLAVQMARVELAAGYADKVEGLLAPYTKPFMDRYLVKKIRSVLGESATKDEVVRPFMVRWEDGSVKRVNKQGRTCVITQQGKPKHVYFSLEEDLALRNSDKTVVFKVTYYSEGREGDTFCVQYDSFFTDGGNGAYYNSEVVAKPAEPGWYTASIKCPRVRFAGRQNGRADFRITSLENGNECIADVVLESAH